MSHVLRNIHHRPAVRWMLSWLVVTGRRYLGKGVLTAVRNINEIIAPALKARVRPQ